MCNLLTTGTIKTITRIAVFSCGLIFSAVYAGDSPETASPEDVPAEHQTGEDATTWDKTKEVSGDAWDATKEGSGKAWGKTKEVSGDAWDATKEGSGKAWESTKEMASGSDTADEETTTENQ